MNNYNLYIFDLDGTILDSKEDIAMAVNYGLEKVGIKAKPSEEVVKYVGYGAKKLIDDLLPDFPDDIKNKVLEFFREFYTSNPVIKSRLYEGVEEILSGIKSKDKKVAVVTNKYEEISKRILKHFQILDLIDIVVGADTTQERKPSPLPVFYALEKINKKKEETIIIGDSETDILTGKNASISTCLVLHGYGNKSMALSLKPDFVIKSLKELEV